MVVLSLAAAFLLGVYVGDAAHLPMGALVSFGLAAAMLAVLMRTYRRSALPALLLLVAILGAARSGSAFQGPADSLIAYHSATTVRLEGVVISDPRAAGTALRFRLAANRIARAGDWTDATGDVLVTLRPTSELVRARESPRVRYGDRLLLVGVVSAPPELEGFDYPAFLERQGIRSVVSFPDVTLLNESEGSWLRRALSGMRLSLARSIARSVPEPQAALGQALVIGKRDRLPDQMVEDFRVTGTSHLMAISGLHLGILLGLSPNPPKDVLGDSP